MIETLLKSFEAPDEVRRFPNGRFEIVRLGEVTFGRATYQPGWRWSIRNAPIVGTPLCHAPHIGAVLSDHGAVQYEDGVVLDLLPGTAFQITTVPHDSWVIGHIPYVSLHLMASHNQ